MKFNLSFDQGEIRLVLSENLALPEDRLAYLKSPSAPEAFALLPQIEAQVRQFLSGFVVARDG